MAVGERAFRDAIVELGAGRIVAAGLALGAAVFLDAARAILGGPSEAAAGAGAGGATVTDFVIACAEDDATVEGDRARSREAGEGGRPTPVPERPSGGEEHQRAIKGVPDPAVDPVLHELPVGERGRCSLNIGVSPQFRAKSFSLAGEVASSQGDDVIGRVRAKQERTVGRR